MRDDITVWVLLALIVFQFLLGWANARRHERIARRDRAVLRITSRLKWFRDAEAIVHRDRRRMTRRYIKGSWHGDCDHGRFRELCIICKPEPGNPCPHGVSYDRCPVCSPLTWSGGAFSRAN